MSEDLKLEKINSLLKSEGLPYKAETLNDVRSFLNAEANKKFDSYGEIEELYNTIMLGTGMW